MLPSLHCPHLPRVPCTDPLCPLYLQVEEIAQLLNTYLASAGTQRLPRPQEPPSSPPTSEPTVLPQGLCTAAGPWQLRPPVGSSHS